MSWYFEKYLKIIGCSNLKEYALRIVPLYILEAYGDDQSNARNTSSKTWNTDRVL